MLQLYQGAVTSERTGFGTRCEMSATNPSVASELLGAAVHLLDRLEP